MQAAGINLFSPVSHGVEGGEHEEWHQGPTSAGPARGHKDK